MACLDLYDVLAFLPPELPLGTRALPSMVMFQTDRVMLAWRRVAFHIPLSNV